MRSILACFLAAIWLPAAMNILPQLETQLDEAFREETYRRYLYYCRQQNTGSRLMENSRKWLEVYPKQEILRFGQAEGLLMMGKTQEGISELRELYEDSYRWANEAIFILSEIEPDEIGWFIERERERTGNPTLHARFMVNSYIDSGNDRKALTEIKAALDAGQNPQSFRQALNKLSERMGEEKVRAKINASSPRAAFGLALELEDLEGIEKAIDETRNKNDLLMMGRMCERKSYLEQALSAYSAAGRTADAARILSMLGRRDEALQMLAGDNSRQGLEQKALLLCSARETYRQAIDIFNNLISSYGTRPEWGTRLGTLYLLEGKTAKASQYVKGLPSDTGVILLKGILHAVEGNTDSVKKELDLTLLNYAGNAYENDLLLLYNITLTQPKGARAYAVALAAYHWADANHAFEDAARLSAELPELADEALLLAAESLTRLGNWKEAEKTYRRLSVDYPESPLASRAKYEMALLLKNNLDSKDEANLILKDLILHDPTSLYADLARGEL